MSTQNNILSCRSVIKLRLSPEEIQRFKTDAEFAKQKMQEAKDLDNAINASINKNIAAPPVQTKNVREAKDLENAINASMKENIAPSTVQATTNEINPLKWSHEAILLLIDEYSAREADFTSGRISQKRLWEIIGNELSKNGHAVSGPQCMSKLNGLKKTYKSVKDHNGKSGNGTRAWMYFDLMDGLIGKKPFMAPVATASSTGKRCRTETESENESDSGVETPTRRTSSRTAKKDIGSILQKSKQVTEENRERRHKEKMEQREKSLALLEKIVAALEK